MTSIATALRVHPDRQSFDRLASEWPLVPVWAELLADVGTPVGLFPAVAGDGPGLLLESVERSERWGRFSFLAGDPAAIVVVDGGGLHLRDVVRPLPIDEPSRRLSPREALRAVAARLRAPRLDGLPPITGGLMGCVTYEAATLLDGHPAPHADATTFPPIALLLVDRAVVFDHWRQRLVLVAHAARGGYEGAVAALEELAGAIATAPSLPLLPAGDASTADGATGSANMGDVAAGDVPGAGRRPADLPSAPRVEPRAVHVLPAGARDRARGLLARAPRPRRGEARADASDRRHAAARADRGA